MSARVFPLDVETVRQYGTHAWQGACVWPVPEPEFASLCDRIEQVYARTVHERAGIISAALLVKRSLVVEYYHFLHAILAIERLRRSGREPRCSASAPWYHQLLTDSLDVRPDGMVVKTLVPSMRNAARGDMARSAKCIAWTVRLHVAARKSLWSARGHEALVSIGVPSEQAQVYGAQSSARLSVSWMGDWISHGVVPVDDHTRIDLVEAATSLVGALRDIAQAYGVSLTPVQVRHLQYMSERQLTDAATALQSVRLRRGRDERLLLSTPGDQFGRVLALALRPLGLSVTSVAHGGSLGLFDSYTMSVNEFAVSDEFATMTEGSASLFQRILAAHPPLGGNRVAIVAGTYPQYHRMFTESRLDPPPKSVRTVMLVGGSYAPWRRPQGTGQFPFYMLHVELEIIRVLRGSGYEVIYKAHPDRLPEASLLFRDHVRVVGGDLRECRNDVDAFIFSTIRTTAFAFALCTMKPVIGFLVEPDRYPLFPDVREILARRCTLLSLQFDERGQLTFDGGALIETIARPPTEPDPTFMERYLFPSYATSNTPRNIHRDSAFTR
ncbi:hypothetical protein HY634_02755 [Candidatus Uhrbacteria bacterium]|nr:hypothetical protein [Candidatus Uhrbacteria bacterium]